MAKTAAVKASKKPLKKRIWDQRYLFLLMIPAIIWVAVICYAPMTGLYMAFTNYAPSTKGYFHDLLSAPFVGLEWFQYFFENDFKMIMRNTMATSLLTLLFSFPAPIIIAILLNEVRSTKAKKFVQTASYLPYFISWVIVSYMLQGILGTETGLLNNLMGTRINYYSTPGYWYPILLILNIWKNTGYNTIVYLAAITGIDEGLYEAAYIDGATRFKRIIYITIPLLAPTICIMTLMSVGRIFYGDFGMLYAIIRDNSSLMPIAEVIDTYVYRTFKNTGDPSLSMAIGLYQSIVGFILVFTANWIVRRKFPDGALF